MKVRHHFNQNIRIGIDKITLFVNIRENEIEKEDVYKLTNKFSYKGGRLYSYDYKGSLYITIRPNYYTAKKKKERNYINHCFPVTEFYLQHAYYEIKNILPECDIFKFKIKYIELFKILDLKHDSNNYLRAIEELRLKAPYKKHFKFGNSLNQADNNSLYWKSNQTNTFVIYDKNSQLGQNKFKSYGLTSHSLKAEWRISNSPSFRRVFPFKNLKELLHNEIIVQIEFSNQFNKMFRLEVKHLKTETKNIFDQECINEILMSETYITQGKEKLLFSMFKQLGVMYLLENIEIATPRKTKYFKKKLSEWKLNSLKINSIDIKELYLEFKEKLLALPSEADYTEFSDMNLDFDIDELKK